MAQDQGVRRGLPRDTSLIGLCSSSIMRLPCPGGSHQAKGS